VTERGCDLALGGRLHDALRLAEVPGGVARDLDLEPGPLLAVRAQPVVDLVRHGTVDRLAGEAVRGLEADHLDHGFEPASELLRHLQVLRADGDRRGRQQVDEELRRVPGDRVRNVREVGENVAYATLDDRRAACPYHSRTPSP